MSKRTKHNALLDCQLLREVYINLLDLKEPRLAFSNDLTNNNSSNEVQTNLSYNKKIVKASDEELENHKNFIKKEIKKNYY